MDRLLGEYGHLAGDPINGYYMFNFLQKLKVFSIKINFENQLDQTFYLVLFVSKLRPFCHTSNLNNDFFNNI